MFESQNSRCNLSVGRTRRISYRSVVDATFVGNFRLSESHAYGCLLTSLICLFACCCFFWYPGVFRDGRDLNAICVSPRILHFVLGFAVAFFPCELRLLFI